MFESFFLLSVVQFELRVAAWQCGNPCLPELADFPFDQLNVECGDGVLRLTDTEFYWEQDFPLSDAWHTTLEMVECSQWSVCDHCGRDSGGTCEHCERGHDVCSHPAGLFTCARCE